MVGKILDISRLPEIADKIQREKRHDRLTVVEYDRYHPFYSSAPDGWRIPNPQTVAGNYMRFFVESARSFPNGYHMGAVIPYESGIAGTLASNFNRPLADDLLQLALPGVDGLFEGLAFSHEIGPGVIKTVKFDLFIPRELCGRLRG